MYVLTLTIGSFFFGTQQCQAPHFVRFVSRFTNTKILEIRRLKLKGVILVRRQEGIRMERSEDHGGKKVNEKERK